MEPSTLAVIFVAVMVVCNAVFIVGLLVSVRAVVVTAKSRYLEQVASVNRRNLALEAENVRLKDEVSALTIEKAAIIEDLDRLVGEATQ